MTKRALILWIVTASVMLLIPIVVSGEPIQWGGYLTVGDNVVVTPSNLRPGDEIALINRNGEVVFKRVVSRQTNFEPLAIPIGSYRLTITRNRKIVDDLVLPVKM